MTTPLENAVGLNLTQPATTNTGGQLGADGILSKIGETSIDLLGLFGERAIEDQFKQVGSDRQNPVIKESQDRTKFLRELPGVIAENQRTIMTVGGIVVAGVIAAVFIIRK